MLVPTNTVVSLLLAPCFVASCDWLNSDFSSGSARLGSVKLLYGLKWMNKMREGNKYGG